MEYSAISSLKACAEIGRSVQSLLGPIHALKFLSCIHNDDNDNECASDDIMVLSCSVISLLDAVTSFDHPVRTILRDAAAAHHSTWGSATTSLVTLAGLLSEQAQYLLRSNISEHSIIAGLEEAAKICEDTCRSIEIPINIEKGSSLDDIAASCSHGALVEARLAVKALRTVGFSIYSSSNTVSTNRRRCLRRDGAWFDINRILVLAITRGDIDISAEAEDEVFPGLVLRVNASNVIGHLSRLSRQSISSYRLAVVDNSLFISQRHVGYTATTLPTQVITSATELIASSDSGNREEKWAQTILALLIANNIQLLVCGGSISPALESLCLTAGIIVIQRVRMRELNAITILSGSSKLTYVRDLLSKHVGTIVISGLKPNSGKISIYFKSSQHDEAAPVATVVVSGTTVDAAKLRSLKIASCLCRLRNIAFLGARVLPGAGEMERQCSMALRRNALVSMSKEKPYIGPVFSAFADALELMVTIVALNAGVISPGDGNVLASIENLEFPLQEVTKVCSDNSKGMQQIFDDAVAKPIAYRRAIGIVGFFLRADCLITNIGLADNHGTDGWKEKYNIL